MVMSPVHGDLLSYFGYGIINAVPESRSDFNRKDYYGGITSRHDSEKNKRHEEAQNCTFRKRANTHIKNLRFLIKVGSYLLCEIR